MSTHQCVQFNNFPVVYQGLSPLYVTHVSLPKFPHVAPSKESLAIAMIMLSSSKYCFHPTVACGKLLIT